MTLQQEYTTTTRRAQDAWTYAADAWTQSLQKVTDQVRSPMLPVVATDATALVEQWFDFIERVNKVNREYVLNLSGVADAFGGAVRQHVEGLGEAVRDQLEAVSNTAKEQVDKLAQAQREQIERLGQVEREQVERAEQAEREQARAARNAERQQARQARQSARERYEGLTKVELAEELGRRDLPKTGNVDDLIERLVDNDAE
jgi:hypothetical protein